MIESLAGSDRRSGRMEAMFGYCCEQMQNGQYINIEVYIYYAMSKQGIKRTLPNVSDKMVQKIMSESYYQ